MSFYKTVFRPAYLRTGRVRRYDNDRGAAVLASDEDIDTYVVVFGPGHYQKLVEAFSALNLQELCRIPLEIIDWGCGVALGTWSFLKTMEVEGENFSPVERITLIEPSWRCVTRGIGYLADLAASNGAGLPAMNIVPKTFADIQPNDLVCNDAGTIKVHIFSNILDMRDVNLAALHRLIIHSYPGQNVIVATQPYNMNRLDEFLRLFQTTHRPKVVSSMSDRVECWRYSVIDRRVIDNGTVDRVEKVFSVRIA